MSTPSPSLPPPPRWIDAIKGMTPTNALVVLLLVCALLPAYVVYRLINDESLLDRFLSAYQIEDTHTACRLIKARQRGEDYSWAITTGFAFEGQTRWNIGVTMPRQ